MSELLIRNWWTLVWRGAAAILFGLTALLFRELTLDGLVTLFAGWAFADGMLTVVAALRPAGRDRRARPRREALLLEGIAGLGLGLAVALWPDRTAGVMLVLVAAWAIATGVGELLVARRVWSRVRGSGLLALAGASSLALGGFLLAAPALGVLAVVWWMALYAVGFGGLLLAFGLLLRGRDRRRRLAAGAPGVPLVVGDGASAEAPDGAPAGAVGLTARPV